ncbi:cytochrome c [Actibacterium sp. MT2.3-13A]|uniref:c-type cytochrome n=1 Tax=Actibacterium sp. MT2.3-13A TaxID=2828332 RepID=UPI001BA9E79D|nr:cytochrome c [Actibacterium sp. MT2.3-13A]
MKPIALAAALAALSAAQAGAQNVRAGAEIYRSYCATCHGIEARGGGPMAEILAIDTPGLTRLAAQNDGVFPLLRVMRQVDGRDPMLAHGGVMPLFGDYFEGGTVAVMGPGGQPILTSQTIADLAAWLETIQE